MFKRHNAVKPVSFVHTQNVPAFWKAFQPVACLGVFGGYMPYPLPMQPKEVSRWWPRWPALAHLALLASTLATYAFHMPPQLQGVSQLGSTKRTSAATDFAMNIGCSWSLLLLMQTKVRSTWDILFRLSRLDVPLFNQKKLRKCSVLLVCLGLFMTLMRALHPISDAIGSKDKRGWLPLTYVFFIWHCSLPVYVLLTQIAFMALSLCEIIKKINEEISRVCVRLCSNDCYDEQAKVRLQQLLDTLSSSFDLVGDISKVYGMPIVLLYLIIVITITNTIFNMILSGFGEATSIQVSCSVFIVATEIAAISGFTVVLGTIPEHYNGSLKQIIKTCALHKTRGYKEQVTGLIQNMSGPPVQITAANFFAINRSLLTTISGAVTTYIIVLAQFQGAEEGRNTAATARNN